MSPYQAYPVRAGQSHLRRPKIREPLRPLTSQAGMPVFYFRKKTNIMEWSAISALTNLLRFVKEIARDKAKHEKPDICFPDEEENSASTEEIRYDTYQKGLGARHKILRESILSLNPREMADFYGYDKVSFLEKCEEGEDEFPRESMQRLEDFFFVNREHIEEGYPYIFQSFPLLYTEDGCVALLKEGFKPKIITSPARSKEPNFGYVVFTKEHSKFHQTVISDVQGNFDSSGGGKGNVMNLILALKRFGDPYQYVSVSHARNDEDWERLKNRTFYSKGVYISAGGADNRNQDIYDSWVREANANQSR